MATSVVGMDDGFGDLGPRDDCNAIGHADDIVLVMPSRVAASGIFVRKLAFSGRIEIFPFGI